MEAQYLVVSDLHLADVEDHEDGWKFYKGSRYAFDEDFADLLQQFADDCEQQSTLILNGDIFDFDLVSDSPEKPPWKVSRSERRRGLRPTPEKSAWKLERILDHHPEFLAALARFSGAGHRVVYVLGNHDREMHFPEVEQLLRTRLQQAAKSADVDHDPTSLTVEPWFFYEKDRIYAEHGNQYDYYSSFRYILDPVVKRKGGEELALPMGNISNRLLMSRMGYFNPHSTDYILNMFRYFLHWFRFYAFSRHGLLFSWLIGSFMTMRSLLSTKGRLQRRPPAQYEQRFQDQLDRSDMTAEQLKAIRSLQKPPITNRVFRIIREFWIDRLSMGFFMTGGTIALALVPIDLWIKLMVPLSCFPLLYFLYESVVQGETVFSAEDGVNKHAFPIAKVLRVPVIVFGHTHAPGLRPIGPNISFVNTGTWAPITRRPMALARRGFRNFLIARFPGGVPCLELGARLGISADVEAGAGRYHRQPETDTTEIP